MNFICLSTDGEASPASPSARPSCSSSFFPPKRIEQNKSNLFQQQQTATFFFSFFFLWLRVSGFRLKIHKRTQNRQTDDVAVWKCERLQPRCGSVSGSAAAAVFNIHATGRVLEGLCQKCHFSVALFRDHHLFVMSQRVSRPGQ